MAENKVKKIVFLTGTRADFGKIKSLLLVLHESEKFEPHIFVTGMHLNPKYGETVREIEKCGIPNIHRFVNDSDQSGQDIIMAETIRGFSNFVKTVRPNMIVVHGDRLEALSGALVGAFNNIFVSHVEGGEISGSIDEHLRHSISKLSHFHFVANEEAKRRLLQMGEQEDTIFVIGSPDIDVMLSPNLPDIAHAKEHYGIPFDNFSILIFHPVTTELSTLHFATDQLIDAVTESQLNYVVIYPNNDPGTDIIFREFQQRLSNNPRFTLVPSVRFEYFLTLLKHSRFIIGNSSAGIREAPYYGVPTINIGSRQNGRIKNKAIESVQNCDYDTGKILAAIKEYTNVLHRHAPVQHFGGGNSGRNFLEMLERDDIWNTKTQKQFLDIDF